MDVAKASATRHMTQCGSALETTHFTIETMDYGVECRMKMSPELAVQLYRALGRVLTNEEKESAP